MAGSVNSVILIGNVGKDPDVRNSRGGKRIASFSMATSKRWTNKADGEKMEATQWHRIVVFHDETADMIGQHVRKGSSVIVQGEIQYREWHDPKIDDKRYTTEIVVDGFRSSVQLITSGDSIGQSVSRDGAPPAEGPLDYGAKSARSRDSGPAQARRDEEVPF